MPRMRKQQQFAVVTTKGNIFVWLAKLREQMKPAFGTGFMLENKEESLSNDNGDAKDDGSKK